MRIAHDPRARPAAVLQIALFGKARFLSNGEPWRFAAPPKTLPLLAYLVLHREKPVSRQAVAFALWPDEDEPSARANLRRHLHYLQASFPPGDERNPWILMDGRTAIQWNVRSGCSIDVEAFERLSQNDESLEDAIELYAGDLLEDVLDDSIEADRQRLRDLQAANLGKLVGANRRDHNFSGALAFAQRLIALDPWREDVVRTIMELRYATGDRAGAIAEYLSFAERSMHELQTIPMAETLACHESIVRGTLVLHEPGGAIPDPGAREQHTPAALPFVGRELELTALQAHWKRARQGSGTFALVAGEAGIGKSRLLEEFARIAESEGARVLRGCAAFNDPVPYDPLIGAVRDALPMVTDARVDGIWLASLAWLIPELRHRGSGLQQLPSLEAAQERQRLFEAFVRVIEALARQRPVLLVLEDLHWAGSATIDLLQYIFEHTAGMHVLVVASYRVEDASRTHPLRRLRRMLSRNREPLHLSLAPFSQESVSDLVEKLSKGDRSLREYAEMLYQRSQGSPLFLTELIRDFRDRGEGIAGKSAANVGLQGIVRERMARLSDDACCLAKMAAIAGSPFDVELLRELSAWDEGRAMSAVNELLDRHVVRAAAQSQSGAYAFSHHLIESAVYDEAACRQIKHEHQRAALVMEELYNDRIDDFAQRIAFHFERSNTPQKAAAYYLRAAAAANAVYAYDEAVALANKGLQIVQDPALRVNLLLARELAHARLGHGDARTRDTEELAHSVQACNDPGLVAEVLIRRIEFYHGASEREAEALAIEQFKSLAHATGTSAHMIRAMQAEGRHLTIVGRYEDAESAYRRALRLTIEAGDVRAEMETHCYLADLHERRGEFERGAEELALARVQSNQVGEPARSLPILYTMCRLLNHQKKAEELIETARELLDSASHVGDRYFEAQAYNVIGIAMSDRFNLAQAEPHFDRALALFDGMRYEQGAISVLNNKAVIAMRLGNPARALDLYRSVRERSLCATAPLLLEVAVIGSSAACLRAGVVSRARVYAREAVALTTRTGSQNRGMALDALGQAELEAGNYAQAQEYFVQALALMNTPEFDVLAADAFANLARARHLDGLEREALAAVERFMPILATRRDDVEEPERLYFIAGQVYGANGMEDPARRNIARAYEIFRRRLESIEDPGGRNTYAEITFHRQILQAYEPISKLIS